MTELRHCERSEAIQPCAAKALIPIPVQNDERPFGLRLGVALRPGFDKLSPNGLE
jgi:hypothetical protein